jgi:hypothetical protein
MEMSQPERRNGQFVARPEAKALTTKPYQKPAVRYAQVFETTALSSHKLLSRDCVPPSNSRRRESEPRE